MNNYVIFTDSACDITPDILKEWGVRCVSLAFRFDHLEQDFLNDDMPIKEFYQNMRDGHVAKTNVKGLRLMLHRWRGHYGVEEGIFGKCEYIIITSHL